MKRIVSFIIVLLLVAMSVPIPVAAQRGWHGCVQVVVPMAMMRNGPSDGEFVKANPSQGMILGWTGTSTDGAWVQVQFDQDGAGNWIWGWIVESEIAPVPCPDGDGGAQPGSLQPQQQEIPPARDVGASGVEAVLGANCLHTVVIGNTTIVTDNLPVGVTPEVVAQTRMFLNSQMFPGVEVQGRLMVAFLPSLEYLRVFTRSDAEWSGGVFGADYHLDAMRYDNCRLQPSEYAGATPITLALIRTEISDPAMLYARMVHEMAHFFGARHGPDSSPGVPQEISERGVWDAYFWNAGPEWMAVRVYNGNCHNDFCYHMRAVVFGGLES